MSLRKPSLYALALVVLAALALAWPREAQALRCGSRIVVTGDHALQVRERCGEPFWVEETPTLEVQGERGYFERRTEHREESWYYNFGPNKLMRRLVFVDSRLVREDTLGYGVNRLGAGCDVDGLQSGLRAGEIVARCGIPDSRDGRWEEVIQRDGFGNARQRLVRREEWIYDPGRGRNFRVLVLVDGTLSQVDWMAR
jgi:hypothetical protein